MNPGLLRMIRRLVLAPVVILLTLVLVLFSPVWLLVAAAVSAFVPGRLRPLRILWLVLLQLVLESLLLVAMFGLWVVSGFGYALRAPWCERVHYRLASFYLVVMFAEARRVLRLRISTEGPAPEVAAGDPLLVLCRHAGPGDSFTLMYALLHWYEREPRIVLKDTIAWDPAIGTLVDRIPSNFISPNPGDGGAAVERQITALATGLDDNDAFVIFPEGGNFSPRRRERGIQRLRSLGLAKMADRAERLTHVLAPRPGGVVAALDGAPDADVVLVAHTGIDHLLTVGDIWRELPMDKEIVMRWWRVPRAQIPDDRDGRIEWLFDWWETIDAWIEEHRPAVDPV